MNGRKVVSLLLLGGIFTSALASAPARPKRKPTLIGYAGKGDRHLLATVGWEPGRGWVEAEEFFEAWFYGATWQVFTQPGARPRTIRSKKVGNAEEIDELFLELTAATPGGICVSGPGPMRALAVRAEKPDQVFLRISTLELLRRHGFPGSAQPRPRKAWRVDLDGDGQTEVLYFARSRLDWRSSDPERPNGTRPDDYALLGLRSRVGGKVRTAALALASAQMNKPAYYDLLAPVDANADGKAEIFVRARYEGSEELLTYIFDGARVIGIVNTRTPHPAADTRGRNPLDSLIIP